jgi:small subunit ribosomal protein S16
VVKIRLKRMGTTKRPVYRLVVADSRSPRDGRFIEAIGFYDPLPNPAVVRIDEEKVRVWMKRGARPSDSARSLLVQQGILAATHRRTAPAPAATQPAAAETAAAAESAPAVEAGAGDDVAAADAGDAATADS